MSLALAIHAATQNTSSHHLTMITFQFPKLLTFHLMKRQVWELGDYRSRIEEQANRMPVVLAYLFEETRIKTPGAFSMVGVPATIASKGGFLGLGRITESMSFGWARFAGEERVVWVTKGVLEREGCELVKQTWQTWSSSIVLKLPMTITPAYSLYINNDWFDRFCLIYTS